MLIASCSVRGINAPKRLHAVAPHIIDTDTDDLLAGANAWITCVHALPHMDPHWPDKLFLTLTVEGDDYVAGDAAYLQQSFESVPVPPVSLFIVDPLTPHWLFHPDAVYGQEGPSRWIGRGGGNSRPTHATGPGRPGQLDAAAVVLASQASLSGKFFLTKAAGMNRSRGACAPQGKRFRVKSQSRCLG
ncbi:hypothetical protein [Pseudorhodoferax sp. Leaf274]|uniref:hypothetical protein n=1 Tax=Pseudorhodoferax sp. Leaf274 TaxID=1736318 RepID=UPI0012E13640|nr:hypothetical protein [Pseudorhodoferax sp. Leaf274]